MSYADLGLDAIALPRGTRALELAVLGLAVLGTAYVTYSQARHDTGCPCLDCNPKLAMHPLIAMDPAQADRVIRDLGQIGPPRGLMGHHRYVAPFDPLLADRAQAALAHSGEHLRRMALVDRLYLDLVDANQELRAIPTTADPRSRFWVVIGALSAIPPAEIKTFVQNRAELAPIR